MERAAVDVLGCDDTQNDSGITASAAAAAAADTATATHPVRQACNILPKANCFVTSLYLVTCLAEISDGVDEEMSWSS